MADRLPAGPYKTLALDDGTPVPFYIIPFDKEGRCEGPATLAHLLDAAAGDAFSNVFIFSHGWNNDWTVASRRYEDFLAGYTAMRRQHQLPMPAGYRPCLVGIFWPSTALVFGEAEEGPGFAALPDASELERQVASERAEVRELAAALSAAGRDVARFYALAQSPTLDEAQSRELAGMLAAIAAPAEDAREQPAASPSADELLKVWRAYAPANAVDDQDYGTVTGTAGGPQAAGLLDMLDPRNAIRIFTVWQMKDRAGTVGARGVGPLLRELLHRCDARVHLIGHSYGAKVVLSAVGHGDAELPRPVQSMLLLQPAVSHLCFAGGYSRVPGRVAGKIFSTFSRRDFPLRNTFHLALRREADLREARIAAGDEPPSQYAALGGYGPREAGEKLIPIQDPGADYALDPAVKVYGLQAHEAILGHGDISKPATWWALYSQVRG